MHVDMIGLRRISGQCDVDQSPGPNERASILENGKPWQAPQASLSFRAGLNIHFSSGESAIGAAAGYRPFALLGAQGFFAAQGLAVQGFLAPFAALTAQGLAEQGFFAAQGLARHGLAIATADAA